jgi:flagellar L-ring protein precursor FlgH
MKKISLILAVVLLAGCSATPRVEVMPEDPFYMPIMPEQAPEKLVENGSLFNATKANSLYSDKKAHQVGDIITVSLRETTTASKSATTETEKGTTLNLDPITAMGAANQVTFNGNPFTLGLNSESEFEGESSANQNNSLFGNISVNVTDVLPNGNLIIRGEKWLTLNNGDEFIRLTGIVRPEDVASDNTVMSTKIANARIQYSGTGDFADTQYQGWVSKFFNSKWWPF